MGRRRRGEPGNSGCLSPPSPRFSPLCTGDAAGGARERERQPRGRVAGLLLKPAGAGGSLSRGGCRRAHWCCPDHASLTAAAECPCWGAGRLYLGARGCREEREEEGAGSCCLRLRCSGRCDGGEGDVGRTHGARRARGRVVWCTRGGDSLLLHLAARPLSAQRGSGGPRRRGRGRAGGGPGGHLPMGGALSSLAPACPRAPQPECLSREVRRRVGAKGEEGGRRKEESEGAAARCAALQGDRCGEAGEGGRRRRGRRGRGRGEGREGEAGVGWGTTRGGSPTRSRSPPLSPPRAPLRPPPSPSRRPPRAPSPSTHTLPHARRKLDNASATWLILPVVICSAQRLSHACLSIRASSPKLRTAHYNGRNLHGPIPTSRITLGI